MTTGPRLLLAAGLTLTAATVAVAQDMPTGPDAREVLALACAPRAVLALDAPLGVVQGSTEPGRTMWGSGETLIIAGFAQGSLAPGQQYYVRRTLPPSDRGEDPKTPWINLHTVAWIRISTIEQDRAIATITHACDAVAQDDFLAAFSVPTVPEPLTDEREPDFTSPGTLLFGAERRANQGGSSYVVVDRGTDAGVRAGQHVVFFRREGGAAGIIVRLGTGLVMEASAESATVRVETAAQPIYSGDSVAFRR